MSERKAKELARIFACVQTMRESYENLKNRYENSNQAGKNEETMRETHMKKTQLQNEKNTYNGDLRLSAALAVCSGGKLNRRRWKTLSEATLRFEPR